MLLAPAERGEVVLADAAPAAAALSAVQVERAGPGQRVAAAQRLGAPRRVGDPVLVAPGQGREPGVERRPAPRRGRDDPDVGGQQPGQPAHAAWRRAPPSASAGTSTWQTWPVACTPASVRPATVSPVASPAPKRRLSSSVQHPGDGAPARLGGPAGEVGAVVARRQPQPDRIDRARPRPTDRARHPVVEGAGPGRLPSIRPRSRRPRRLVGAGVVGVLGRRRRRSAACVGGAGVSSSSSPASAATASALAALRAVALAGLGRRRRPTSSSTSSMIAIGAASPLRGPVLTIRV